MSSSLALIVLGQAYFLGSSPNVPYTVPLTSKGFSELPSTNPLSPPPPLNDIGLSKTPENHPPPFTEALTSIKSNQPTQNHPKIRDDYTYTPGIGAHKVHSYALRWKDARKVCQEEGGDLAIINSEAEQKILVELLAAAEPSPNTDSIHMALIGFHDQNVEGQYETVDGKPLSESGYEKWGPGEPNNGQGLGDDCGSMWRKGTLNDANCYQRFAYICELPHPDIDSESTPIKPVSESKLIEQVTETYETTEKDETRGIETDTSYDTLDAFDSTDVPATTVSDSSDKFLFPSSDWYRDTNELDY